MGNGLARQTTDEMGAFRALQELVREAALFVQRLSTKVIPLELEAPRPSSDKAQCSINRGKDRDHEEAASSSRGCLPSGFGGLNGSLGPRTFRQR